MLRRSRLACLESSPGRCSDALCKESGACRKAGCTESASCSQESHVPRLTMATKVVMEALSPTMEEGRLVKWLKNDGEAIKSGDVLAEVETDKAIMELVARGDGVLRKRIANEGDASPVGTLLAVIAPPEENIDALIAGAAPAAPADATPAAPADAAPAAPAGATSSVPS